MASPELVTVVEQAARQAHGTIADRAEQVADAVERFLDGPGHVVAFHEDRWTMEHTVACRLVGMEHCQIHKAVDQETTRWKGPLKPFGRYKASIDNGTLLLGDRL